MSQVVVASFVNVNAIQAHSLFPSTTAISSGVKS